MSHTYTYALLLLSTLLATVVCQGDARAHPHGDHAGPGSYGDGPRVIGISDVVAGPIDNLDITFDRPLAPGQLTIGNGNGNIVCNDAMVDATSLVVIVGAKSPAPICYGGRLSTRDGRTFTVKFNRPIPEGRDVRVQVNVGGRHIIRARDGSVMQSPYVRDLSTTLAQRVMLHGIEADGADGIIVVGSVVGAIADQRSVGRHDAFVARLDRDGTLSWARQFGTTANDIATAVARTPDGIVVTGHTGGTLRSHTAHGRRDVFVRAYAMDGTLAWSEQLGSPGHDEAHGIAVDARGEIYVVGHSDGDMPARIERALGPDSHDIMVMRLRADGRVRWSRTYGPHDWRGSLLPAHRALDVAIDGRGRPIVVGDTYGHLGGQRNVGAPAGFAMALDRAGKPRWTRLTDHRSALSSIALVGADILAAGVGPTTRGGTFMRLTARGKRIAEVDFDARGPHVNHGDDVAFTRVVSHPDGGATLVGHRVYLDEDAWALRVVGLAHARVDRKGRLTGPVHEVPLTSGAYIGDAVSMSDDSVCVAGAEANAGFIRCFGPDRTKTSLDIALEPNGR